MATFKRKRGGKDGKAEADGVWTIQVVDHLGIRRRIPGFASRAASAELERNIRKLISIRQAGGSLDSESNRFLESVPASVRDKLADWGIIAEERAAAGQGMVKHIADWRTSMQAKGLTQKQIIGSVGKVERLTKACRWRFISDINAPDLDKWRNDQKTANKSSMTLNHYLVVAKTFAIGW